MVSYDSYTYNVAPDLIRPIDNVTLSMNHHFEYERDSDYAWFNFFDVDYNFINLELWLPRNIYGEFDTAIMGEPYVVDLYHEGIKGKPNRFARYGNVVVLSFKQDNKMLIKDLSSDQTQIVEREQHEKNIGQQILRIDPINAAYTPESHDRIKIMYHVEDLNYGYHSHRTFINEI